MPQYSHRQQNEDIDRDYCCTFYYCINQYLYTNELSKLVSYDFVVMKNKWRHGEYIQRSEEKKKIKLNSKWAFREWVCILTYKTDAIVFFFAEIRLRLLSRAYSINRTVHALSLWTHFFFFNSLSFSRCALIFYFTTISNTI